MIRYQLLCEHDHEFEAWFKDSKAYDDQVAVGDIQCPFCGNIRIRKAVMAPNVATGKMDHALQAAQQEAAIHAAEKAAHDMREGANPMEVAQAFVETVHKIHQHVQENFEDVGEDFVAEARAIHQGEAEERAIYGQATREDTQDLLDEGIEVVTLPSFRAKDRSN